MDTMDPLAHRSLQSGPHSCQMLKMEGNLLLLLLEAFSQPLQNNTKHA